MPSSEFGVRSSEFGVRSSECGVRSAECGVRSAEYRIRQSFPRWKREQNFVVVGMTISFQPSAISIAEPPHEALQMFLRSDFAK